MWYPHCQVFASLLQSYFAFARIVILLCNGELFTFVNIFGLQTITGCSRLTDVYQGLRDFISMLSVPEPLVRFCMTSNMTVARVYRNGLMAELIGSTTVTIHV